jgi:lipid-A-disaccharide synthase-like uncharacterized protein
MNSITRKLKSVLSSTANTLFGNRFVIQYLTALLFDNRFAVQYFAALLYSIYCTLSDQLNFAFLFILMASLMDGMNHLYHKNK